VGEEAGGDHPGRARMQHALRHMFLHLGGTGPFDATGLDALMTDVGDGFVFQAVTEKGKAFVAAMEAVRRFPSREGKAESLKKAAEGSMGPSSMWSPSGRTRPWTFSMRPSGTRCSSRASIAAHARSSVPPAGASTFRMKCTRRKGAG